MHIDKHDSDAADIPEEAASDIQTILADRFYDFDAEKAGDESDYSSDSYYEEKGTDDSLWQEEWRYFERSLKTEARFFSRSASHLLASVFDGIERMQTLDGRSLIIDAGPETKVSAMFRARSFQSDEKLKNAIARPDKDIGPPPSADAAATTDQSPYCKATAGCPGEPCTSASSSLQDSRRCCG